MKEYRTPYGLNVVVDENSDVYPADIVEYKDYNVRAPLIKHNTRAEILVRARVFALEDDKSR